MIISLSNVTVLDETRALFRFQVTLPGRKCHSSVSFETTELKKKKKKKKKTHKEEGGSVVQWYNGRLMRGGLRWILVRKCLGLCRRKGKERFYLTTHSTHFIYGYIASDIWLRTILIVRKETRCRHIGYSFRLTARVLLYAPSHRQDSTYHGLCWTSRGALAGTRYSSMGPP